MNTIRKTRIKFWCIIIVISIICYVIDIYHLDIVIEEWIYNTFIKEKISITVDCPPDMKSAFSKALKSSGLKGYKISLSDNQNDSKNLTVAYAKENNNEYTRFSFSPFIIAYSCENEYQKKLKNSNVLIQSEYDKNFFDFDFKRIITEITEGNALWTNLGIPEFTNIKVFFPSETTIYYHDFYNFMLVTINNGFYPQTEEELQKSEEILKKFVNSKFTEAVSYFDERIERIGFPGNVLYVLPEKTAIDITKNAKIDKVNIFYPIDVVYLNYYVKGDELGNKLISSFDNNFYGSLYNSYYRSINNPKLKAPTIDDDYYLKTRDIYNVVEIPIFSQ